METKICVVGLGYVGLPLALLLAEKGFQIYGLDINKEIIEKLKSGACHINDAPLQKRVASQFKNIRFSTDNAICKEADIIVVTVPTPVDKNHKPDLMALKSASADIARNLKKGQLVIIESTIFPATVEGIVQPILESSGLKVGADFSLAHCPERVDPGNTKYTLVNIPRVVAGITESCTERAYQFYSSFVQAPITKLSSVKAAEATKMVENIFRDVNIALVNELAQSFDASGIDVLEVLKGASSKPFAFMPHYPGCGVGGHCIPVDPYYLIESARLKGFEHRFLSLAREINNAMPKYTVKKALTALQEHNIPIGKAHITVLGMSYKGDVDDMRESPALEICNELKKAGATFDVYDPFHKQKSTKPSLQSAVENKDCIIIATAHSEFRNLTPDFLIKQKVKIVIDGRNMLDKETLQGAGIIYKGIGR